MYCTIYHFIRTEYCCLYKWIAACKAEYVSDDVVVESFDRSCVHS
jgi:hypothetical protein